MTTICQLYLILLSLLVGGVTSAPASAKDEDKDVEAIVLANAGLDVIEGDITPDSYTRYVMGWEHEEPTGDLLLHDGSRKKKATYTNDPKRIWPDGIIPFRIGAYIDENSNKMIHAAMDEWMSKTCIKFKAWTNEKNYVTFVGLPGCTSRVGMVGNEQIIRAGERCDKGIVMHELGHALGFWHEHSRPDRDEYIEIKWGNISGDAIENFKIAPADKVAFSKEYDYGSIMHYGKKAFGGNRVTIVPKKKVKIGQREHLSDLDIRYANILYKCTEHLIEPEPTILIQSTYNGLCIEVQLTIGGAHIPILRACNNDSTVQQWKWNKDNQLYNLDALKCISTGSGGLLELSNCTTGDSLQHWLCADHFIEQPSTGNCATVDRDSQQLIAQPCNLTNYRQLWNKYEAGDGLQTNSLSHLPGSSLNPICTIPHLHTTPKCYDADGWTRCSVSGYFVRGLYHGGNSNLITKFYCCYTPHVFTGRPGTATGVESETCSDVAWWSQNSVKYFKCQNGFYFKGYSNGEGLLTAQKIRCCRIAKAPLRWRHCESNTFRTRTLHKCFREGYHIAGVYKTASCTSAECIERLLCCI